MKSNKPILIVSILCVLCLGCAQNPDKAVSSSHNQVYACPPCNSDCDNSSFDEAGNCPHCGMKLVLKSELENMKKPERKKIAFYLQDGVEILDFGGPLEVFNYAGYEVFTVSKSKKPIKAQGILTVIPDYSLEDAPQADILAFFGGNARTAYEDKAVIEWIKKQKNIDYHFSVCTGAFMLAESGVLKDKTATTFHSVLDELEKNYPDTKVMKNARFVDNGRVITTAGISAGIDGALHLVAKLQGFNAARETAYYMEYDKWAPGEGVILSDDNPYEFLSESDQLKAFEGVFEHENNETVEVKFDKREQSLNVIAGEYSVPLFFIEGNIFKNLKGEEIEFRKNDKGEVTGYQLIDGDGMVYKKL